MKDVLNRHLTLRTGSLHLLAFTVLVLPVALMTGPDVFQWLILTLPLMIWIATRFPLSSSLIAVTLIAALSVSVLHYTVSPENWLPLDAAQSLLLIFAATAGYIRFLLAERESAEEQLETTVAERTRALLESNRNLLDEVRSREEAEASLLRSSQYFRTLFETTSNPIIVIDEHNGIRQWNSAAETLFGYSREDALDLDLINAFIPDDQQDEMAWKLTKMRHSSLDRDQMETRIQGFDGSAHTLLWNLNRLPERETDRSVRLMLIGQDISDIRETQNQLHYLAHYDVLTDTANRRLFEDRCRQAITTALRHGHYCALISLDVDHFKRINDTLGHDAGDELLQELSRRLRDSVRREDTIARLGGDEFAVLLNHVNGAEGCEKVARSILEAITEPVRVPGGELVITSSIGITIAPEDGRSYEELLRNADMAMYRAKKAGRNNIQFFSEDMNDEMQRQLIMERELGAAIRNSELDLYYQPVLDLKTGAINGVEALLRWRHPRRGLLTPADFLDVAEQTGQLQQLGEWICQNACLQSRAIQAMSGTPVWVSINLSSRQYNHPQLTERLRAAIRETRLDPGLLAVEIDERLLSDRLEETAHTLHELRSIGIGLTLDRFGSGLSSLRLLRELPFDQVKIDHELLKMAPEDDNTAAIVRTLINLARQLSLKVSATGVERPEEDVFVRAAGSHMVQGHRFCEPLPSSELPALFEAVRDGRRLLPDDQFNLPLRSDSNQS
ncbi:PAS domain S-box-containing protein/diguanylate cyclase (GGDEF)-like protein [Tamilnaduibacter salinus]|uniref:PAS domain S-box-containing protein/diguanylate cyclase (GGDEF)-like protein n=1 Tax=Tamilnaduibacter salinus TaxID=1484056 RepID=A0A2U1CSZ8_9GAMM|nr:EAL domain-containing protein [Tamilnaduibacter salinus]PVY69580.1 PAS domain S-box-containing protein/diguanylate cyclase (GGDEF)-like protein [Tamilnaduibacter salinus]